MLSVISTIGSLSLYYYQFNGMKKKGIRYQGKVVFEKVVMQGRFDRFPKLFQKDEACFLYMSEGTFSFRTPTDLIEIKAGEAVVAKCGNYFIEQSFLHNQEKEIIVFGAYFYPEMVKDFFQTDLKLVDFKRNFDVSISKVEPMMGFFIESINYLIENPELADNNLILSKMKELLLLLGKTDKSIHNFVNALFTPYEYDFKEIILHNMYSNISLTEIAMLCGCSLATFKRRFSKYFNQSPSKYFLHKKLEKSSQLLSIKSNSITEIAFDCGFENINHFNKAFKKHFALTPSQMREKVGNARLK